MPNRPPHLHPHLSLSLFITCSQHHVKDLLLAVTPEGCQPAEQDVQAHAQRPDVGSRAIVAAEHLGGNVERAWKEWEGEGLQERLNFVFSKGAGGGLAVAMCGRERLSARLCSCPHPDKNYWAWSQIDATIAAATAGAVAGDLLPTSEWKCLPGRKNCDSPKSAARTCSKHGTDCTLSLSLFPMPMSHVSHTWQMCIPVETSYHVFRGGHSCVKRGRDWVVELLGPSCVQQNTSSAPCPCHPCHPATHHCIVSLAGQQEVLGLDVPAALALAYVETRGLLAGKQGLTAQHDSGTSYDEAAHLLWL